MMERWEDDEEWRMMERWEDDEEWRMMDGVQ